MEARMENKLDKPQLVYFENLRGVAQFPRVLMRYLGVEYDDVLVKKIDEKLDHELKFHHLPLWRDVDGFKLNESVAISKWIAENKNFIGRTMKERALVAEAISCIYTDILYPAVRAAQGLESRDHIINHVIPRYLGAFEKELCEIKVVAGGSDYTVADVFLYVIYDYLGHLGFAPKHLQGKFPNLDRLKHHFESNNAVASYLDSRPDDNEFYKNMHKNK